MNIKIASIIEEICKEKKIKYRSPLHSKLKHYKKDKEKLVKIYWQLKQIIAELTDIERRYSNLNGIRALLEKDITYLENILEDIIYEIPKIKE